MLVGIIGAMAEEVESLKMKMQVEAEYRQAKMTYIKGRLWNQDVVVVVSGIGKVNAAICTQIMIDQFNPDYIINVGVAGGLGSSVQPGHVVVGTSLIQHDMDASRFGYDLGQIPRMDTLDFKSDPNLVGKIMSADFGEMRVEEGVIVTGDQFVACPEKVAFLLETFDAKATEMEGASIAQVAYLNEKPFIVIRSISDNASTGASMEYEKFVGIAVENSLQIIQTLLEQL